MVLGFTPRFTVGKVKAVEAAPVALLAVAGCRIGIAVDLGEELGALEAHQLRHQDVRVRGAATALAYLGLLVGWYRVAERALDADSRAEGAVRHHVESCEVCAQQ